MESETNNLLNQMLDKLEAIRVLLENAPKTVKNTTKTDLIKLTGTVEYAEMKEGKNSKFKVWKLSKTARGDISCLTFDQALFDAITDNSKITVLGTFKKYKAYTNFVVEEIEGVVKDNAKENKKEESTGVDMPF